MKVTCVVDNAVCDHSTFWGEHGLAFLIETKSGLMLLFDAGQSGTVLLHNLKLLDIVPRAINALAISHAHYDHTGGLPALLDQVAKSLSMLTLTSSVSAFRVGRSHSSLWACPWKEKRWTSG